LLKKEFDNNYKQEILSFQGKCEQLDRNQTDIDNIDVIYQQLIGFMDRSAEAKILTKINDISDFMNKSIEDLERITNVNGIEKQDF
jgi:hypothetical protein